MIITLTESRLERLAATDDPMQRAEEARSRTMEVLREYRAARIPSRAQLKPLLTRREASGHRNSTGSRR